jgi:hypothetical protein
MSVPQESERDDDLLTRYVLGLLSEEEREQVDEASIVDDEVAARLRSVENDLIDGYVRGTLGKETLKRFESYYLSSRRRRESVRFASGFVRAVDRAAARGDTKSEIDSSSAAEGGRHEKAAGPPSSAWVMTRSKVIMALAAVAALLLVACGVLMVEAVRTGNQLKVMQAESAALDRRARDLERQLEAQRAASPAASQPERALESVSAAASPAASQTDRPGAAREARTIALVLLPQTRAIASIPTIVIPPGTDRVALELRLESDDFPRYQAGLQDPATNEIVWRSGWLASKASADRASVSVLVPAGVLKTQHYSLQLTGRGEDGRDEVAGSYVFQILPR